MRKSLVILTAAILFFLPSFSEAMDFHPLRLDIQAKIQAIRNEVRAKGGTYEVGYSAAMDKSISQLCGLKVPAGWNKSDAPSVPMLDTTLQTLPSSYDWRSLNGVTPVKNQGSCGSCWAFGTVGPLESQILIKDGAPVDLSEQYLVSCNLDGWSCSGGWWAHDYHLSKVGQDNNGAGAVPEAEKPYTGTNSSCVGRYDHLYKISHWAYVGSQGAVPEVQAIKQAILDYGPISAAVYVGPLFQHYSSGIFNTKESGQVNHAIVLVGWKDDATVTNGGYWILRNSWGPSWGESGYMRISYGINQVGYSANFIQYAGGNPAPSPPPPAPPVKPDLTGVFTSLSTSNSGRTLNGNFQVQNIGTATAAKSFSVFLYLSNDKAGTTNKTLLGSVNLPASMGAGSYSNVKFSKSSTISFRGKWATCVVDPGNTVSESNEGNNVIVKQIP